MNVESPVGRALQLFLLTLAVAAGAYSRTVLSPLQEAIRLAFSLTDNQMALLQGPATALPLVMIAIPLGLAIDRRMRTRLLVVAGLLNLLGSLITVLAAHFVTLLAARCLVGVSGFATVPIALSILADSYSPDRRGRVTTVVSIGQLAGSSAAFVLGGELLAKTGAMPEGWRWAMGWLASPLFPILLLLLAIREPSRTGLTLDRPLLREVWGELWRYRAAVLPLMAGMICVETALGAVLIWTTPTLSRCFGLPPERIGVIMAMVLLLSGALGPILGGNAADWCQRSGGPRRTASLAGGLALLALPAGIFGTVHGAPLATGLLVGFMTTIAAIAVVAMTLFTVIVPTELRGLCISVSMAANIFFALAVGPVVVSLLAGALGGPLMIGKALACVCALTSLSAAALFAGGRRYFPTATG